MKRELLACLLATSVGCIDFTAVKLACFDAGNCVTDMLTPPTLESQVPIDGAMNVSANAALVLTFSRAMDPTSVHLELTPPDAVVGPDFDDQNLTAIWAPSTPLRASTMYTARVTGNAADDGAALKTTLFTFTTAAPPDTTAPALTGSLPTNMAANVSLSSTLQLDFNEAMSQSSLVVNTTPSFDWGPPTWMGNGMTVRFLAPPMPLTGDTDYTLAVDAADLAGNPLSGNGTVLFTTVPPPDSTVPTVMSMSPPGGSTGVSFNVNVALSFSEPMKPSVAQALSIAPPVTSLACSLDGAGTLLTCSHPGMMFAASTSYTVTLKAIANLADGGTARSEDLAGNVLAADFTGSFMTGTMQDVTPPTVVAFTPDAGALGLPYYPSMTVTFSESMDKALTQAAIAVSLPAAVTGTYSWDAPGRKVTFTPTAPQGGFLPNTPFNWQVGSGAKDLAGNSLGITQQYSFRVRRQVTVAMTSTAADGYLREVGSTRTPYAGYTYTYVGDTATNDAFMAFFPFDFAGNPGIPTTALGIVAATLDLTIYSDVGDLDGSLGHLKAEAIPYVVPFSAAAWTVSSPQPSGCTFFCLASTFSPTTGTGERTATVTLYVRDALAARHVLFRVRPYTKDEDAQSDNDYVVIRTSEYTSGKPTLNVTYEVP